MRRHHPLSVMLLGLLLLGFAASACSGGSGGSGGLANQERVTVAPNSNVTPFVVNVTLTDTGFQPQTVFVPAGYPIRLVLRNHGAHEHHYRVEGLIASEVRWVKYPVVDQYTLESEDLTDEELIAIDPSLVGLTDEAEIDHVLHHLQPTFELAREVSLSGIKPLSGEVHGYAQRGEFDTLTFFPLTTGRYSVEDVLNPEITGSMVVFLPPSESAAS